MAQVLCLSGWERFQHYKDRDPPWVKLYRDLLTSESWVLGTDTSRLLQVASIMLAARYTNKIPFVWNLVRRVASLDCSEEQFHGAVTHLQASGFLEIQEVAGELPELASTALATCTSEAEQRQSRAEADKSAPAARPVAHVPRVTLSEDEKLDFKLSYPERNGDQKWHDAWKAMNARMREGHTYAEILSGAQRYAKWCEATGKVGTETVKQAATFVGPGKPFLLPWHPPPKLETASERILRLNGAPIDDDAIEHEPFGQPLAIARQ